MRIKTRFFNVYIRVPLILLSESKKFVLRENHLMVKEKKKILNLARKQLMCQTTEEKKTTYISEI